MVKSAKIGPAAVISTLLLATLSIIPSPTIAAESRIRVASTLSGLPYDENSHLASHLLVFPASGPCASLIENIVFAKNSDLYGHIPIALEGEAAATYFKDIPTTATSVTECPALCLERGVDSSLVAYPMPHKYYNPTTNEDHTSFVNFLSSLSCGRVEFGFINYFHKNLSLQWVDPSTQEHKPLYYLLQKEKNTRFIHTFIGHRFVAIDTDDESVVMDHTVEFNGVIGIQNHINVHEVRDIRNAVEQTMGGEWRKHLQVKRTFSALGFDKGRLPDDIFGSMRSYYYNNRNPPHRLMEEWDSKGVYVNYWETVRIVIHQIVAQVNLLASIFASNL